MCVMRLTGKAFCLLVTMVAVNCQTHAAGFDATYNAFQGDLNADGRADLHLKGTRSAIILAGKIPIVIGPPVREFALKNNGNGSFNLIPKLSATQKATVAQWLPSDVQLSIRDVDQDGHSDLDLLDIRNTIPNTHDYIVLSSSQWGAAPSQLVQKTSIFRQFHDDLDAAILNPNYFDENAPNRVVGAEPPSRDYYGSVIGAGNFASTSNLLTSCSGDYPTKSCNLSTVDPSPCVRTVAVYDEFGQFLGIFNRNVCGDFIHVFVYNPGSVSVVKDYSVFNEHARESKDILDRLQANCSLFEPSADTQRIDEILGGIYGTPITIGDGFIPNSVGHPPAPGDELFDESDPTFHHYDVRTRLCDVGQPACNLVDTNAYSQLGLRAFTYPSFQLQPTNTAVNGSELLVFVTSRDANNPQTFIVPFGTVTQRFVQTPYWAGGVQNVTTSSHFVYPGTILRKMFQEGSSMYVRTHGMGVNRTWCIPEPLNPLLAAAARGVRILLAAANDSLGAKTFKTMDGVMRTYWRTEHGFPAGTSVATEASQINQNQLDTGKVVVSRDFP